MATVSSNIGEKYYPNEYSMIPLNYISRLVWNIELGVTLKQLRGKVSRRALSEKLKAVGYDCSHQYIQKLEEGKAESVAVELLAAIAQALGVSLGEIVPMVIVDTSYLTTSS